MDLLTQNAQRSNHRLHEYDVALRRICFFPDKTFRATRLKTGHREGLRTGNGRVLPVSSIRLPEQIRYPFLPVARASPAHQGGVSEP